MRSVSALFAAGVLALVVQGALATIVSPPWCPDLGLLVVLSIGLRWRDLGSGLVLAAALGFAADLLSGSLVGQHALLRVIAFSSAYLAGRQLNLKGSLPLVVFAVSVSFVYGVAVYLVSTFFVGAGAPSFGWLADGLQHAVVNGVFAVWVFRAVTAVATWSGDPDAPSRTLPIDARRRAT
jgi:rod shape-determining protein MreD